VIRFGDVHRDGCHRSSPPAVLLRESYRDEHGRAQKRMAYNIVSASRKNTRAIGLICASGSFGIHMSFAADL